MPPRPPASPPQPISSSNQTGRVLLSSGPPVPPLAIPVRADLRSLLRCRVAWGSCSPSLLFGIIIIVNTMAQRDKKGEEPTELHAPEITLCANSCGFPGNPATNNLCQNCFLAASSSPPASVLPPSPSSSPAVFPLVDKPRPAAAAVPAAAAALVYAAVDRPAAGPAEPKTSRSSVNRCHSCRKRVGLTGFRCRCGELFCGSHRYSDRHQCSFDYKSVGRDAIARENPVVRAAKIVRF